MTEKLSAAKAVYDSSESTQVAIDTAKDNLQSAIANLIPKSQLNATKLYEAVQSRGNYTEEFLDKADFSREEIKSGLVSVLRMYGYEGMTGLLM